MIDWSAVGKAVALVGTFLLIVLLVMRCTSHHRRKQ